MSLAFSKYQGTGNDFILLDGLTAPLPALDWPDFARRWCDRHYGIGGDGLILVLPGQRAPFAMAIYNADGTRPEMCGNGLRCFARYLRDVGRAPDGPFDVETDAGVLQPEVFADGTVRIAMGAPILDTARIPAVGLGTSPIDAPIEASGERFAVTPVSMGNPHAVIFVPDVAAVPLEAWGPALERHGAFPARANVEFVQVLGRAEARMRVWERGAGPTLACGTGACATLVAGVLTGRLDREATVHMPGGPVTIAWPEGGPVYLTGPAERVFEGRIAP